MAENPFHFSEEELQEDLPVTRALTLLSDSHFRVFNEMEGEVSNAKRDKLFCALGILWRAAAYLRGWDITVPGEIGPSLPRVRKPNKYRKALERIATHFEGCYIGGDPDDDEYDASAWFVLRRACEVLNWKIEFDQYSQIKLNKG